MSDEPVAYVAQCAGNFHGVISASLGAKRVRDFYSEFAGCDIVAVFSRDEYLKLLEKLK